MFTRSESFSQFIRFYPAVSLFSAICVILYVATVLPLLPARDIFTALSGVNFLISEGEYWRLVTPIFMHAGLTHILFNVFSLIIIGPGIESLAGTKRFVLLFLLSGILANVLTLVTMPPMYVHVGASGAIFGIFGCYAYILLYKKHLMSRQNSQTILALIIISVVLSFMQASVNLIGHIGGLASGFLLAPLFLKDK